MTISPTSVKPRKLDSSRNAGPKAKPEDCCSPETEGNRSPSAGSHELGDPQHGRGDLDLRRAANTTGSEIGGGRWGAEGEPQPRQDPRARDGAGRDAWSL